MTKTQKATRRKNRKEEQAVLSALRDAVQNPPPAAATPKVEA